MSPAEQKFKLKIGTSVRFISCGQILYIKAANIPHHITIFTADASLDYTDSLANIEKLYPTVFIVCSRSLLVNRHHIQHIERKDRTLTLSNGIILPFSIRCLPNIKKFLSERSF